MAMQRIEVEIAKPVLTWEGKARAALVTRWCWREDRRVSQQNSIGAPSAPASVDTSFMMKMELK